MKCLLIVAFVVGVLYLVKVLLWFAEKEMFDKD